MPRTASLNNDAEADAFLRARPKLWPLYVAHQESRIGTDKFVRAAGLTDDGDLNLLIAAFGRKVRAAAEEAYYARVPA